MEERGLAVPAGYWEVREGKLVVGGVRFMEIPITEETVLSRAAWRAVVPRHWRVRQRPRRRCCVEDDKETIRNALRRNR